MRCGVNTMSVMARKSARGAVGGIIDPPASLHNVILVTPFARDLGKWVCNGGIFAGKRPYI